MEEGRLFTSKLKKPTLPLVSSNFKFTRDLKVGDKGQISCVLEVESIAMEMDETDNERKIMRLSIDKIDLVQDRRIVA